jgi:RNAse (barnase) inhibitor barstar
MASAAHPLPYWLTVSTGPAPAVLDGRACRTRAAFFEEVARALHLPAHFGHNWDALADSLRDTAAMTLIITHAEDLLTAEPPQHLTTLLDILANAARSGLTVTLHTDHEPTLRHRLTTALP